jgi:hypothetical protein
MEAPFVWYKGMPVLPLPRTFPSFLTLSILLVFITKHCFIQIFVSCNHFVRSLVFVPVCLQILAVVVAAVEELVAVPPSRLQPGNPLVVSQKRK